MQTFLPEPHIVSSLQTLDNQRLGKQRVEGYQILNTLLHLSDGWRYHPATKMWIGHERVLALYTAEACMMWENRGFEDNLTMRILAVKNNLPHAAAPWWFGDPDFHRSHQSNLLRKNPSHYRQYWRRVPDNLPYLWPCMECETFYPQSSCITHRGDLRSGTSPIL